MMFTDRTIKREMDLCAKRKRSESDRGNDRLAEFYYGAETALAWARNNPNDLVMRPSNVFPSRTPDPDEGKS